MANETIEEQFKVMVANDLTLAKATEKFTFPQEEFLRIVEIYFGELFKRAVRGKRTVKQQELRDEATVIAILGTHAAFSKNFPLEKIKKAGDLENLIRQATGMDKVQEWLDLNTVKESEEILKTSQQLRLFKNLYFLVKTEETKFLFKSLAKFRKTVSELFDWLKIVKSLNEKKGADSKIGQLMIDLGNSQTAWNKNRIYLTMIVGMTLGVENLIFTSDEILRFIKKVKDPNWIEDLRLKFGRLQMDVVLPNFFESYSIQEILGTLKNPDNQNPVWFLTKVRVHRPDARKISVFSNILSNATKFANKIREEKGGEKPELKDEGRKEAKQRINYYLSKINAELLYSLIESHPHLLVWLNRDEFLRIAILDHVNDFRLKKLLVEYSESNSEIREIYQHVNSKKTVAEMMYQLIRNPKPFGWRYSFYEKNRNQLGKKLKIQVPELYSSIVEIISIAVQFDDFMDWLNQLGGENDPAPLGKISLYRLVGYYLLAGTEKIPAAIKERLKKEPWFDYLEPEILESFKRRVKEKKKKK